MESKGASLKSERITLINTIRNTVSFIVLQRVRPSVEEYLYKSQGEFRTEHSTSDIVWLHKWIAPQINISHRDVKIMGVEILAAFDTKKKFYQ